MDVGFDPGVQFLVGEGFGEDIVAGAQHGDEEEGGLIIAAFRIRPAQRFPGPVQKGLLPGDVPLPESHLQGRLPALVVLAELGVAVAVGLVGAIFLPQQLQRHVPAAQLLVDVGQVRQWAGRCRRQRIGKEQIVQLVLVHLIRQRPTQTGFLGPLQIGGDGAARPITALGDLAIGELGLVFEAKNFPDLAHGQPPLGHRYLLFAKIPRTGYPASLSFRHMAATFRPKRVASLLRIGWPL